MDHSISFHKRNEEREDNGLSVPQTKPDLHLAAKLAAPQASKNRGNSKRAMLPIYFSCH
jgi:hypothetical protein